MSLWSIAACVASRWTQFPAPRIPAAWHTVNPLDQSSSSAQEAGPSNTTSTSSSKSMPDIPRTVNEIENRRIQDILAQIGNFVLSSVRMDDQLFMT